MDFVLLFLFSSFPNAPCGEKKKKKKKKYQEWLISKTARQCGWGDELYFSDGAEGTKALNTAGDRWSTSHHRSVKM